MSFDNEPLSKNGSLGLPPEILVEIFTRCLPSDHARLSTHPQLLPPFTLAQVCSYWRYLVTSCTRLWSRIVLGRHGTDSSNEVTTYEFWLARTGTTQPLEILLDIQTDDALEVLFNDEASARYARATTVLIEGFCANSRRWRSLVLDVLNSSVLEPLFRTLCGLEDGLATAPLLEELELTTTLLEGPENARTLHNFSANCPQLRSLTLTCPTLLPEPVDAPDTAIFKNMRVLKLRFCISVPNALAWVDVFPHLEYLKVHFLCESNEEADDPQIDEFDGLDEVIEDDDELDDDGWVVVNSRSREHADRAVPSIGFVQDTRVRRLLHLTRLEIVTFSTSAPVGSLLDSLSAPSLRSLKISSIQAQAGSLNTRWLHAPLFLHRSDIPSVEELEINGVPMNIDDMCAALALVPGLHKLTIGWFPELDELLQQMEICDGEPSRKPGQSAVDSLLCPRLESLNVADASFSIDALASMVSSRCKTGYGMASARPEAAVAGLKRLCVRKGPKEEIAEHPAIARCVAQGLDLREEEPILSFRVR